MRFLPANESPAAVPARPLNPNIAATRLYFYDKRNIVTACGAHVSMIGIIAGPGAMRGSHEQAGSS
jgi:hypothetical protein